MASRLREFLESPCSVLTGGAPTAELELDSVVDKSFADVLLTPDMILGKIRKLLVLNCAMIIFSNSYQKKKKKKIGTTVFFSYTAVTLYTFI